MTENLAPTIMPFAIDPPSRPSVVCCLMFALAGMIAMACSAAAQPVVRSQPLTGHPPAKAEAAHPGPPHPRPHHTANATHKPEPGPADKAPPPPAAATLVPAAPAATPAAPAEPPPTDKGSVTGLPLPRFAALRSDEVNLRSGPGTRYPIDWVYQRRDLPVEIEREFEVWRLVEDYQGTKGWVHQATLTGRRGLVVVGGERTLHVSADPQSPAVAKLMPGVIGRILKCAAGAPWCEVQIADERGWLPREAFWGSLPTEAIP